MKQITALLMAIMLTLCLLKVKGGDASVVFNLEGGNGVNSVPLTVSLAVNGGISGASVSSSSAESGRHAITSRVLLARG